MWSLVSSGEKGQYCEECTLREALVVQSRCKGLIDYTMEINEDLEKVLGYIGVAWVAP